ncbi:Tetratricopeptide repeat protein [Candidatus Koribacter versatilis Ellin345]|uniref:Tetratricopeptide repeat protein n=1 Tax=Koribacter versatilis (strain Ellin345) TaxID=204669 RepID=Q1IJW1_KORVE|nr:tetratricopeptide repeat protein [Candidatus Koribacter versatilis]ABF42839.1 Tetratricopeptide repeat protein [Candidatus Koribacter versatilis Ellin345]
MNCERPGLRYLAVIVVLCVRLFAVPQAVGADIDSLQAKVKNNPTDPNAWVELGNSYHQGGKDREAITAYSNALEHGYDAILGKYNLAVAYAGAGEKDKAIELLQTIVAAGLAAPIGRDPDFAKLVGDSRFDALAQREQALIEPCMDATAHPEYRQLDFWLGEWEVFGGSQKVGDSKIELILKNCVVLENWTDTTGGQGKSFNKYDPARKAWEQFWVEDNGSTNYFIGTLREGEMRYELVKPRKDGGKLMRHLTFSKFPDGSVRQFSQSSTDDGKSWSVEYDFIYRKKAH